MDTPLKTQHLTKTDVPDTPSPRVPNRIRFRLIECDEFFDHYVLLDVWSAFDAACLLNQMEPIQIDGDAAVVGVISPDSIDQDALEAFSTYDQRTEKFILGLAASIQHRWKTDMVPAREVVDWALAQKITGETTLTRKVLGRTSAHIYSNSETEHLNARIRDLETQLSRSTDNRGKHHEDKRMAILGYAIKELAENFKDQPGKIDGLFRGGEICAAGIARHLDAFRKDLGIPDEETSGFGMRNISSTISFALTSADRFSTDKK